MAGFIAQQEQQFQALREEQQAQVKALQSVLATTQAEITTLRQNSSTPATTSSPSADETPPDTTRRKAILPDPPKFDGTRSEYEGWRSLIYDKIEVDGEVIGSPKNQFLYIASRLEGKGLKSALTFITANRNTSLATAQHILNYLDAIFGDRHKVQRVVET